MTFEVIADSTVLPFAALQDTAPSVRKAPQRRGIELLTHRQVDKAQAGQKLSDGNGLYLDVSPTGGKSFRFDFRFRGRRQTLTYGRFPDLTLKNARIAHKAARAQLVAGVNPCDTKKNELTIESCPENTLEVISRAVFAITQAPVDITAIDYKPLRSEATEHLSRMLKHVCPTLGQRQISDITSEDLQRVINAVVENSSEELARRVQGSCFKVWEAAIAQKRSKLNIVTSLKKIPRRKTTVKHYGSIQEPKRFSELLQAIDKYSESADVSEGWLLKLWPYLFLRASELRVMQWGWIDFENKQIRVPARVMKMKCPHIVPMSRQVIEMLRAIQQHESAHKQFVFPSAETGLPLSRNTVLNCLEAMGFGDGEMTGHGARSFWSTQMNEMGWSDRAIDLQLAHNPNMKEVERAYNYAKLLPVRAVMLQCFADYLTNLRRGSLKLPPNPLTTVMALLETGGDTTELLRHELEAARNRIADLEQQLAIARAANVSFDGRQAA